jgi:hypothetical protein
MDPDNYWYQQRMDDAEYAGYVCRTCRAHYDHHASADLSCPAYTIKGGETVFSDIHKYHGPQPRRS